MLRILQQNMFPYSLIQRDAVGLLFKVFLKNFEQEDTAVWKRNSGKDEDQIIQNQFTAYLCKAIGRRKFQFIRKQAVKNAHEVTGDLSEREISLVEEIDLLANLPPLAQLENQQLLTALLGLTERERYILLAHTFSDRGFSELAQELNSSYKAVSVAYCRAAKKVRLEMGGEPE